MNRRVEFRDIDMNQHYTVEMIVARSVDGVEQLMARAGLSHVELYYKRNIFAAKIQSTFHKELALGDRYIIRTKITKVTGSLMDIRVAFLDKDEVLCFEILWTILIVLDSTERILLDWENIDLMEEEIARGTGKDARGGAPDPEISRQDGQERTSRGVAPPIVIAMNIHSFPRGERRVMKKPPVKKTPPRKAARRM